MAAAQNVPVTPSFGIPNLIAALKNLKGDIEDVLRRGPSYTRHPWTNESYKEILERYGGSLPTFPPEIEHWMRQIFNLRHPDLDLQEGVHVNERHVNMNYSEVWERSADMSRTTSFSSVWLDQFFAQFGTFILICSSCSQIAAGLYDHHKKYTALVAETKGMETEEANLVKTIREKKDLSGRALNSYELQKQKNRLQYLRVRLPRKQTQVQKETHEETIDCDFRNLFIGYGFYRSQDGQFVRTWYSSARANFKLINHRMTLITSFPEDLSRHGLSDQDSATLSQLLDERKKPGVLMTLPVIMNVPSNWNSLVKISKDEASRTFESWSIIMQGSAAKTTKASGSESTPTPSSTAPLTEEDKLVEAALTEIEIISEFIERSEVSHVTEEAQLTVESLDCTSKIPKVRPPANAPTAGTSGTSGGDAEEGSDDSWKQVGSKKANPNQGARRFTGRRPGGSRGGRKVCGADIDEEEYDVPIDILSSDDTELDLIIKSIKKNPAKNITSVDYHSPETNIQILQEGGYISKHMSEFIRCLHDSTCASPFVSNVQSPNRSVNAAGLPGTSTMMQYVRPQANQGRQVCAPSEVCGTFYNGYQTSSLPTPPVSPHQCIPTQSQAAATNKGYYTTPQYPPQGPTN